MVVDAAGDGGEIAAPIAREASPRASARASADSESTAPPATRTTQAQAEAGPDVEDDLAACLGALTASFRGRFSLTDSSTRKISRAP